MIRKLQKEAKTRKYAQPRNYVELGSYLRDMRVKAGLTQREVSLALNYSSAQFISNFECGIAAPPLKKLRTLVNMYKMSPERVMSLMLDAERYKIAQSLNIKRA